MTSKHPFSKRKANATQSTISFRFNKHDEEVEEVFQATGATTSTDVVVEDDQTTDATKKVASTFDNNEESFATELKKSLDSKEIETTSEDDDSSVSKHSKKSEDSIGSISASRISIDSNSKSISRRACSLDSEYEPAESEGWAFLKDLKGKITKNIEECINKDVVKGLVASCEEVINAAEVTDGASAGDSTCESYPFSSHLPSSFEDVSNLSPSVEATESLESESMFDIYDDEEILIFKSSKQEKSKSQIDAPSKKKKPVIKADFNMKLSSLMESRAFSAEDCTTNEPVTIVPPVIASDNQPKNICTAQTKGSDGKSSQFCMLFLKTRSFYHFIRKFWNKNVTYMLIVLIACKLMPIPSAVRWFFIGAILSAIFMYWVMKPAAKKNPLKIPDYRSLPPLTVPASDVSPEPAVYTGWMNELPLEYNVDTYHVNCTHSVHIRLDGSSLRMSYPKNNIPKRAMFNERRHELPSLYPRHHDLTGATVELLPQGLPKKRLWSKKYPICLRLIDQRPFISKETESRNSKSTKESSPSKKYEPNVNEDGEIMLYMFARTDREKDDWYRRFVKASRIKMLRSHSPISSPNIAGLESSLSESKRAVSVDLGALQSSSSLSNMQTFFAGSDDDEDVDNDDAFAEIQFDKPLKFEYYMSQLLCNLPIDSSSKRRISPQKEKSTELKTTSQDFSWLNALIGRLFFDFLTEDVWADVIGERIQRKLSKIKLPNFIEELKITDKRLGSSLPKIHRTSNPVLDHRGMWIDIDISYNGGFQMTLETKLNLLKLQKHEKFKFPSGSVEKELETLPIRSYLYDSEEDDTAESSSDEDVPMPEIRLNTSVEDSSQSTTGSSGSGAAGGSTGKKLIHIVNKIAQSSYFQSAAKNKFIKRAMVEVSNTPLVLTVEIQCLTGTLAVNVPPMPTDRLWYGFRKNPELCIQARPKLGCRAVTVSHIIEWIEKKLVLEFQKVLVMPNMDDIFIPIMHSDVKAS